MSNISGMNGVGFSWLDLLEILSAFAGSGSLAGLAAWLIQRALVVKNTEQVGYVPDDQRMEVALVGRGRAGRIAKTDGDRFQGSSDRTRSLVHAVREYRKFAELNPLALHGSDYARVVQELDKAIDLAETGLDEREQRTLCIANPIHVK